MLCENCFYQYLLNLLDIKYCLRSENTTVAQPLSERSLSGK